MIKLLAVVGLALALMGSFVAAWGTYASRSSIADLAGTHWDENPHLRKALTRQSNCTVGGFLLIAAGTISQIVAALMSA